MLLKVKPVPPAAGLDDIFIEELPHPAAMLHRRMPYVSLIVGCKITADGESVGNLLG